MKSTLENPLYFFEYIFDEVNIKNELEKSLHYSHYLTYKIELPNYIHYVEEVEFGNTEGGKTTVESLLKIILQNQFELSKKLMRFSYLNNEPNQNRNFLNILFNTIQSLIYRGADVISRYPCLLWPLRGLVEFINEKLMYPDMQKFVLNEGAIQYGSSLGQDSFVQKSNIEIIHAVLDYMKGKNEKQETILSEDDFNLLIKYTTHLIEKEGLPEVSIKLKPNLSNDVVRFSFWVLHNELYTTTKIRTYFYDFIKNVFEKFKNNDMKSIKSQFGTKKRVKYDDFLPEIIKKHLLQH